ncbi:aminotransferase class I/II-fold pyridoxal phosphate-dependent enzyme [Paenibacillus silvae]|uniref:aminotransferase class I/II-fold pyridoxal phosphate-dependent enzyme n=1 Tax=Paenibacillus silvae TaxID=1325358 RepID=UPI0011A3A924|nr:MULTISPECIES: aminotransferase class I/II-fold pyridoxal phosphate-dependent enzyme [Paenibacillus]MCK6075198.1 aminotransferase class I/II-fold pyridoxal phosphate-dependent enzyme [Paenibacillus silvae]MCK6149585.1 aminotransferase class I/II-fold pyridoxal phosphate-dependent enzyme [Paenibacillus silvae]MCK6267883.1 aminotransferase class I/II-fold pyridoxal phosphate-dependent enzyme [Paenibacillus silvae]
MEFAKRMNHFSEGIFTKLLDIKRRRLGQGQPVIDLSVGTPNIPPAPHIMNALCEAAADPANYIYAVNDQSDLLQAASDWYKERYHVELDPQTEICSLLGSQEGLAHISLSIVDEGDLVLVPDPCYPVFADGPLLAGAELCYMPQKEEHNYVIQLHEIPEAAAERAKFMLVSYPNNPTTAMAPDSFYEELIAFAKKYSIIVLHDNAYSELVFDGKTCGSFLSYPGAMDVGIEFNSLSKTYGLAGARIGFCLGNANVVSMLKKLKSNMDYGMFIPIQRAAISAITGDQTDVGRVRAIYEERRDMLCEGFAKLGWLIDKPEATMFIWTRIPAHYSTSEQFATELVTKAGVIVTPGSAFGPSGEGYVRLALVQDIEQLQQALDAVRDSGILIAD